MRQERSRSRCGQILRGNVVGLMDKAKDAMNSDKGEQTSDKALDKGEQLADQKTGGGHQDQVDKGRDLADGKIGNE
jgi:hypothetical protein